MKVTSWVFALGLVVFQVGVGFSYTFQIGGRPTGTSFVGFEPRSYYGNHWDRFSFNWDPALGETKSELLGNAQHNPLFLKLLPELGDSPTATVPVLLRFSLSEKRSVEFANYEPIPYDVPSPGQIGLRPGLSAPPLALYFVWPGDNEVVLSLAPGVDYFVNFGSSATLHEAYDSPDTFWHPKVIDPTIPGSATVQFSGTLSAVSIQVIPEPSLGSLLLGGVAVILAGKNRRQKH